MYSKIDLQTCIGRNPNLVVNDIDGEIVMMSIENGEYYGLDEIGSRIWELLQTPQSVTALIDLLLVEFEVDRSVCEADVLEFINQLVVKGLILKV